MTHPITTYLKDIKDKLATGQATEHTHRPALAVRVRSFRLRTNFFVHN